MDKVYILFEYFEVDGGYGDAIPADRVLFVTDNKEDAEAYRDKWSKPEVYDTPYDALTHHEIVVEEWPVVKLDLDRDPWKIEEE